MRWFSLDSEERNLLYFKNPLVNRVIHYSTSSFVEVGGEKGFVIIQLSQ